MVGPGPRRAFRVLLKLFPAGFRRERGKAMEALFVETWEEWRSRRGTPGLRFWAAVVADTAVQGLAERISTLTHRENVVRSFAQDVRYAVRQLVRRPLPAVVIILLMALGIAANTAVFRVVNGLFLKPLPFPEAERLVDLDETAPEWNLEYVSVAYADFAAWREGNRTFESMALFDIGGANLAVGAEAERVTVVQVTHDLDDVLGLDPSVGRFFAAEEDVPGGPAVAMISDGFWTRRFDRDPDVLGETISLQGVEVEVVGVLPPAARFLGEAEIWQPLARDSDDTSGWSYSGIGRLRPGVTPEQARADLEGIHRGLAESRHVNEITSPVVASLRDRYLGELRLGAGFLLGAVGVVLLIACANIAGLMVARGLSRAPEIAIRRSLGAARERVFRQLLTESAVLALVGAVAGTALGVWASSRVVAGLADQVPTFVTFDLDGRVLLFTIAVTAFATLFFGLLPAFRGSAPELPGSAARSTGSAGVRRTMGILVAGEVALALALLVVGGLSVADVIRLGRLDPGFDAERVLSFSLSLPPARYADGPARLAFVDDILARARAVPGVEDAAVASALPTTGHWGWFFEVVGAPERSDDEGDPVVLNRVVSPGYLRTMGLELVAGRFFDDFDGREDGGRAVVVNETFVRTFFESGEDPVGAQLSANGGEPMTVVGVARDVMHYGADEAMRPGVYQPLRQLPLSGMMVAVRVSGEPGTATADLRRIVAEVDPELPLYDVQTMAQRMDSALWTRRATSWVIGSFSVVGLFLAVAGLFGVISYSVGQRSREISIRLALGARRGQVRRQVVLEGMALVAVGTVVGLGVALAVGTLLSRMLVGVSGHEPMVYVVVTLVVLTVAVAANDLPARRAARLDPMRSLRGE